MTAVSRYRRHSTGFGPFSPAHTGYAGMTILVKLFLVAIQPQLGRSLTKLYASGKKLSCKKKILCVVLL
jgi:hypothetical protein